MTRTIAVLLLLLCCSSLWAADATPDRWRISILASEISKARDDIWAQGTHAGIGLGLAYAPSPEWDAELTVSRQSYISPYTMLFATPPEMPVPMVYATTGALNYHVYPVDLSVTRHFLAGQRISPYVRAGARFVRAPKDRLPEATIVPGAVFAAGEPVTAGFHFNDRLSGQVGAGVQVRLTAHTALRAEVTQLLRTKGVDFDPLTRVAVGVSWAF
jgi:hypothetical protein